MDVQKAREAFERRQAKVLNMPYKELKARFDENFRLFGARYNIGSINEKEWNLWLEAWQAAKAKSVPEVINVGNELQSWVAVWSFKARHDREDYIVVDANLLAEKIENLTGANA